jgi:hypothetical protein
MSPTITCGKVDHLEHGIVLGLDHVHRVSPELGAGLGPRCVLEGFSADGQARTADLTGPPPAALRSLIHPRCLRKRGTHSRSPERLTGTFQAKVGHGSNVGNTLRSEVRARPVESLFHCLNYRPDATRSQSVYVTDHLIPWRTNQSNINYQALF